MSQTASSSVPGSTTRPVERERREHRPAAADPPSRIGRPATRSPPAARGRRSAPRSRPLRSRRPRRPRTRRPAGGTSPRSRRRLGDEARRGCLLDDPTTGEHGDQVRVADRVSRCEISTLVRPGAVREAAGGSRARPRRRGPPTGLVEDEQVGVVAQRARGRAPSAATGRRRAATPAPARRRVASDEGPGSAASRSPAAASRTRRADLGAAAAHRSLQVVQRGQVAEARRSPRAESSYVMKSWKSRRSAARRPPASSSRMSTPSHRTAPRVGLVEPAQQLDERRLARRR